MNDSFVLFPESRDSEPNTLNARILKPEQLNGIQPSFIFYLHVCFSSCDMSKCFPWKKKPFDFYVS